MDGFEGGLGVGVGVVFAILLLFEIEAIGAIAAVFEVIVVFVVRVGCVVCVEFTVFVMWLTGIVLDTSDDEIELLVGVSFLI